jgi:class 3 adenylate cyclase
MNNSEIAKGYYLKGIKILRKLNDSIQTGSALLNAGDEYFISGKLDSALILTNESVLYFENLNYPIGHAYSLGNLGMIYAEQGLDPLAEKNITKAIQILETLEDYYPISVYLTFMSDIYLRKGNFPEAMKYAKRSLVLAQKNGLKEQISGANLKLSELYEYDGDFETSNMYLKNYYSYRDSVLNIETVNKMADLRTNMEVSQKQAELDLLIEKQKNQRITVIATIIALVLIIVLAAGLFRRNRFIQKTSAIVKKEKERSDKLLLNILPEETAMELKDSGKVTPKRFDSVTVMFTDFRAFTKYSQYLTPELLVKSVDFHFSKFDEIMEKYGLEKIKTMGDAYMCAGGLPFPSQDHAEKMILAAFEIVEFIDQIKEGEVRDISHFDIRIGIHTGPVVAGVVGTKKFAYDIWGDTVNIASRMESNSEPGRINVSERTYELVSEKFDCEYRGEIQAKNKGMMKMYFANGLKHQTIPNQQSKKA